VALPGWLMVLVNLASLLVPVEIFLFVAFGVSHASDVAAAMGLGIGAFIAFMSWSVSAAWLVLRRRAEVVT
jgi:hypothetical protein